MSFAMMHERESVSEQGPRSCPRCSASEPRATLLTSMVRYFACRRCGHRWRTSVKSKGSDDGVQGCVMNGSISVGDVVVCLVNDSLDLYAIGTVVAGAVGEFPLSNVTTVVGLARALEEGYRNRTPDERVWLSDGTASGYVKTTAPRSLFYL